MESSGKSNPRIVLSAHRARNKTIVMGADQLGALRSASEIPPTHEQVADLLGVVGETPEQGSPDHSALDHALFDIFAEDELMGSEAPRGSEVDAEPLENRVDPLNFVDDAQSMGEMADAISSHSVVNDGIDPSVDSDHFDASSEESTPVETDESSGLPGVIDSGTVSLDITEESSEISGSDADGSALYTKEKPETEASVLSARHPKERPHRLLPSGMNGGALVGFLVSFDADPRGMFVELREGRMIVTSESVGAAPCLVIEDSSVSPMHAIMRISSGEPIYILDQLSEFGTRIIHMDSREDESLSGEKGVARHGDVVFFGEKKFHVCLVSIEMGEE
jgi:hypothetical protein